MLRSGIGTSIQGIRLGKQQAGYTGLPVSLIQAGASTSWESGGENRKGGVIPGILKLKGADEWNSETGIC